MMAATQHQESICLSELLEGFVSIAVDDDREITSIQTDSRKLNKDDLFIAMQGVEDHGLTFLADVLALGATAVLYDSDDASDYLNLIDQYKDKLLMLAVDDLRDIAGQVIDRFYLSPSEKMHVVAVTGTDGKTSVTRFLAQAMSSKTTAAVIGTTGNGVWGSIKPATHTTPDVLNLHKLFFELAEQQTEFVAVEVSSHGIDQKRIAGVSIDTAVLTNVSRDHLDYHGSVENYRAVKKQLFALPGVKNRVINIDDATGVELAKQYEKDTSTWVYGFDGFAKEFSNFICVEDIKAHAKGFKVSLKTSLGDMALNVPLLGRFNVSNVLSVIAVQLINDINLQKAVKNIEMLTTAPGRMECFQAKNKPSIVVDYAHTPKALELALVSLREHFSGRVWCVFGCGGNRDQGKRALMGEQAENHSDISIITDDNPRDESSNDIVAQVLTGFNNTENAIIINDRRKAIEYACDNAAANDVVLIAGKGHEEYQIIGDVKKPFSDRQIVQRCLGGVR